MVKKSQKNYFWANLGPFWPKTGQKDFSEKNEHRHILTSIILYFHAKNQIVFNDWISRKSQKNPKNGPFWAPFAPKRAQIYFFSENRASSLFEDYNFASSCKKSENFNEPILRKTHNRRTDERRDGRTNGQGLIYRTFTSAR